MGFTKISEKIFQPQQPSYFLIREFSFDRAFNNVLLAFMKGPFFRWKENKVNEVSANIRSCEMFVNWDFHGLYDIAKLNPNHFENVSANEFIFCFTNFIKGEIGNTVTLPQIKNELTALSDLNSEFYIIRNLPPSFHHEWTVFDFFISGFKINRSDRVLTAVEFGLD